MSSPLDPAKLKVVELRQELTARGLDSKGNKPALVKRLKDALDAEVNEAVPDTSVANANSEDDLDTEVSTTIKTSELFSETTDCPSESDLSKVDPVSTVHEPEIVEMDVDVSAKEVPAASSPVKQQPPPKIPLEQNDDGDVVEKNGEHDKIEKNDSEDVKVLFEEKDKSGDSEDLSGIEKTDDLSETTKTDKTEDTYDPKTEKSETDTSDQQSRGEKRRRDSSGASQDRSQRRRSKSPPKEDEPPIDNDKVQLSWYDSDLHLQLDKESFLSAKPLHEGAFGYAWAGVRATHGVSTGKVCYEVKITEELAWDDFSKLDNKNKRDYRSDRKKQKHDHKKDSHKKDSNDSKGKTTTSDSNKKEKSDKDEASEVKSEEGNEKMTEEENSSNTEKKEDTEEQIESEEKVEPEDKMETEEKIDSEEKINAEENMEVETEPKTVESKDEKQEGEDTKTPPSEPIPSHLFRVGWSLLNTDLQLGEHPHSFAYESSARFVNNNKFDDYAIKCGVGDVVGAFLSIDTDKIVLTYTINGVVQTNAATLQRSDFPEENFALFPHVLSRNYAFELNLGRKEEPWFPVPLDLQDYSFLEEVEEKVQGPLRPEKRSDCEVILMCGLPASGKTHWVEQYVKDNPDKKYTVIGNKHFLEKMTVSGNPLKDNFKGRWSILLDRLQKSLNKIVELASLRRRNYIIDQTNVFPTAQRRKMRQFEGFKRRAVVVVVGDEEQTRRQALQEAVDGKDVPDSSLLEMKANMNLPQKGDLIDEVIYAELGEEEAKEIVKKYNTAGREAGYRPGSQRRYQRRDYRFQNRRNDNRGKNYRDRNFHNNRYDRGGNRHSGNWQNSGGGDWYRNRRDNRAPPPSRDWRNQREVSGRSHDRGNRDSHRQSGGSSYNRSRNGSRSQSGSGTWSSGGGGSGSWSGQANQSWGAYGQWGSGGQNYSQSSQNQWKYGGGSGQGYGSGGGGYGSYYYGQYPQNWNNPQGQGQSSGGGAHQYSQQAWAQYAQQYVQQTAQPSLPSTTNQQK